MQPLNPLLGHRAPKLSPMCLDSRKQQADLEWVLLLEDDPTTSRGLSRWLKRFVQVETRSARTVYQAECWLRSMPPPLAVISDFDLQAGENGASALKRFRGAGLTTLALILTGAPTRARAALNQVGLDDVPVLSKSAYQSELQVWLLARRERQRSA